MSSDNGARKSGLYWLVLAIMLSAFIAVAISSGTG